MNNKKEKVEWFFAGIGAYALLEYIVKLIS